MALLEIIGNVATVITILSFLTGLIICRDIYRKRSTSDFTSFPFAAGVFCTFLWFRYGLLLSDPTMIFVNSIGLFLQCVYLAFFYLYTLSKSQLNRQVGILLFLLFSIHLYARYSTEPEGLVAPLASLASLIFCASPLAAVSEVIASRSTEKLPFALILSSFIVSSLWFSYGYLLDNNFVMLPNGIGTVLAAVQLSLFVIYPAKSKSQNFITNGYRRVGFGFFRKQKRSIDDGFPFEEQLNLVEETDKEPVTVEEEDNLQMKTLHL